MFSKARNVLLLTVLICSAWTCADVRVDPKGANDNPFVPTEPDAPTTTGPEPTTKTTEETTTEATSTTTEAPPSTTVAPAPVPEYPANIGRWNVTDKSSKVACIMMEAALQLQINYTQKNKSSNATAKIDIPKDAIAFGECEEETSLLGLVWSSSSTENNTLVFIFEANNSTKPNNATVVPSGKYGLVGVNGTIYKDSESFPNASNYDAVTFFLGGYHFQSLLKHSYLCNSAETLKDSDGNIQLKVARLHLDAFRTEQSPAVFQDANVCIADDAGGVVPIAVGATLAGLVVVVLVGYLIGRRRTRIGRTRIAGYQSV